MLAHHSFGNPYSSRNYVGPRIAACHSDSPDASNCQENSFETMNLEFNQVFSHLRFVCTLGSLSHAIEQSFCTLRGYCERTPSQKLMRQGNCVRRDSQCLTFDPLSLTATQQPLAAIWSVLSRL
ncbi:hypothetical protein CBM2588_A180237 [Cupriavidus taiwanensis]|nr:hypothetical protein CBM2588_A180237 [Cupriavidus taiwanensis]SOZ57986.1 hypothetical protein CBM2617_A260089 [Cupriavidus taiwanensis]SOZ87987.1 hypothetical protein CBM2621_A210237 [Cupriavidus taiwanensis]